MPSNPANERWRARSTLSASKINIKFPTNLFFNHLTHKCQCENLIWLTSNQSQVQIDVCRLCYIHYTLFYHPYNHFIQQAFKQVGLLQDIHGFNMMITVYSKEEKTAFKLDVYYYCKRLIKGNCYEWSNSFASIPDTCLHVQCN